MLRRLRSSWVLSTVLHAMMDMGQTSLVSHVRQSRHACMNMTNEARNIDGSNTERQAQDRASGQQRAVSNWMSYLQAQR